MPRRTPYTLAGISRVPCWRCGSPSRYQWQSCADNQVFRPLCRACNILLNDMVLKFMGDPERKRKMEAYRRKAH